MPTPLFSSDSTLFAQYTRGGGYFFTGNRRILSVSTLLSARNVRPQPRALAAPSSSANLQSLDLPTFFLLLLSFPLSSEVSPMQTATVKWIGEQKFLGISPSGHAVALDSDRESSKAPGPMELLLVALGACTATAVVIILEKKRQKLDALEVIASGERAADPPAVWTKLELLYRLRGRLDEAAVKHAIELSEEKYCSVAAMLKKTATLTYRYEILK